MSPFHPRGILTATDFSEISTWALRHAVMWAKCYDSQLTVLHVQEPPPVWSDPYLGSYSLPGLVEQAWTAASQQLERYVVEHVPSEISVTRELMAGSAPDVIEEYVSGGQVDMVVLGTHGRGGLSRFLLGSVAERTLRMARHPTLIVRQSSPLAADADGDRAASTVPRLEHILCPVNDSEVARAAFEHACSVAHAFGARLTALMVAEPIHQAQIADERSRLQEKLQSWLPAEARSDKYELQTVVRHGDAAEEILGLTQEVDADLVVIGAQHRRFVDTTVLGVTTVRVTRHAPCPVLVVPRWSSS
jgi:nucleotide-binding universal stress UspA family protein